MRETLDRLVHPLHAVAAALVAWLLASSPWLGMIRRIPPDAGWLDLAHVGLGALALPLAALYLFACTQGGRWRLYYPWLGGGAAALGRDLAGLLRGRRPMSEGGGLFGTIEGLLLAAGLVTAASGVGWWLAIGSDSVLAWRLAHIWAARVAGGLVLLHLAGVALHVVDLVRD